MQDPDELDTYAATLAARTLRALMAITAAFNLEAVQWDAVNAFTNSLLEGDPVYCECPEGFEDEEPGKIWLLLRALYGLRTSPLLWLKEFSKTLRELGLKRTDEEVCLFQNDWLLVFFFVNDIVDVCRTADLSKLQ